MTIYPLCVAWNIETDTDFIAILRNMCETRSLPLFLITPENLEQLVEEKTS